MRSLKFKLPLALAMGLLSLASCQKQSEKEDVLPKISTRAQVTTPNIGEVKLQEGVLFYPANKVSNINSSTVALEVGNYDKLVYATKLTDLQQQGLGATLALNLNVYAGTAQTEPFGYLYYFKTAKGTTVPSTENDPVLTTAYQTGRVEIARYILPYLSTVWNQSGLVTITTSSPVVPYTFDISPFASALKDQDSTVWIASSQGQPGNSSYTYKTDLTLTSSGNTDLSSWQKDNYTLPIVGFAGLGSTLSQTKSISRSFTVPDDITNAKIRVIYTGPEGYYTTNVLKLDNQQIDSYSTRMVCVPEQRYQQRNPSVANGTVQPGLWNYPTRNYCQSDTVPPHTTLLINKLTKGTHELKLDMTQNVAGRSDYGGSIQISISLIGTRVLGATLFQHCDYAGNNAILAIGSYTTAQMLAKGINNNDISSLKIPANYKVTLYDGDNFTGASLVLTANETCLINKNFNDKVSSLKIEKI
ncbi:hypothetical protein [Sphingobacterium detergens]|uniref:Beta/gamma crystallin 'Greek key' domain-containing protein n=1 Tax=Sphingobacterium detergens TaxID=1145106 RepID=A0A420BK18_SPHD1|nr:hypothetical protein [Sphingobacterium detergens]RKE57063.1 hypothetical protein DFQ12_1939 [Sphingobacterium detergens]